MYDSVLFLWISNQTTAVFWFVCSVIYVCYVMNNKGFIICTEFMDILVSPIFRTLKDKQGVF